MILNIDRVQFMIAESWPEQVITSISLEKERKTKIEWAFGNSGKRENDAE